MGSPAKIIFKKALLAVVFAVPLFYYVNCSQKGFQSQGVLTSSSSSSSTSNTSPDSSGTSNPVPGSAPLSGKSTYVFVAQGHVGRTVMSCDQGKTWINDRSNDQDARCWVTTAQAPQYYLECDHQPDSGGGIVYGDGWFYTGYGHGGSNTRGQPLAQKSKDGINWQTIYSDSASGGSSSGILYSSGKVLWIDSRKWPVSSDGGLNWISSLGSFYFMPYHAVSLDNLVLISNDDTGGVVSVDFGKTYLQVVSTPNFFWSRDAVLLKGNGHLISISSKWSNDATGILNVYAAESKDGGLSWTGKSFFSANTGESGISSAIFNGKEFVTWFNKKMWKSTNGTDWTSTPIVTPGDVVAGPVAISPSGVYVSIPNVWGSYYSGQKAYYSTDGLNWTQGQLPGSHPIGRIAGGYVDSSVCGL